MKIITIGRGENSHVFIDNPLVSRQHALLKIKENGKMVIVDKSSNGTSINGSPIKKDRETPVSRKDVVTFAGVSQLDWKEIPDPLRVYKIIGLVLAGIAVILGIIFGIRALLPDKGTVETGTDTPTPAITAPAAPKEEAAKPQQPGSTKQITQDELDDMLKDVPSGSSPSPRPRPKAIPDATPTPAPTPTPTPTPTPAPNPKPTQREI